MGSVTTSHRRNAVLAWAAVALLVAFGAALAASGALLWAAVALLLAATPVVPAVIRHDWRTMPPWALPAVTTLPFLFRPYPLLSQTAAYFAVASVALTVVIYLTAFTDVEMTTQFAIAFVLMTTVAVGTVWAGVRGMADIYVGTTYIGALGALERDLLFTAAGGVLAGVVFETYLRTRQYGGLRGIPVEEA